MELLNAEVFAGHGGHAGPTQRNLFAEIAEWAKALRAIPGQKNIILFTMGFGNGVVRPGRLNSVLFETMARALASANAPVFTVDTSPQAMPGREVWDKLPSGTLPERSLAYLSETTGGKFLGASIIPPAIATDIQDATANYYVLGYSIPVAWDGKYHDVKVDVVKPGYKVHAQRGYFNPVPFAELSPIEKHLHLIDLALSDGASAARSLDFPMTALPFATTGQAGNILLLYRALHPGDPQRGRRPHGIHHPGPRREQRHRRRQEGGDRLAGLQRREDISIRGGRPGPGPVRLPGRRQEPR